MTQAERVAKTMADTERLYGPLRDPKRSREAAVAANAETHSSLMDGAL